MVCLPAVANTCLKARTRDCGTRAPARSPGWRDQEVLEGTAPTPCRGYERPQRVRAWVRVTRRPMLGAIVVEVAPANPRVAAR